MGCCCDAVAWYAVEIEGGIARKTTNPIRIATPYHRMAQDGTT
jgi:hypothetical protein